MNKWHISKINGKYMMARIKDDSFVEVRLMNNWEKFLYYLMFWLK